MLWTNELRQLLPSHPPRHDAPSYQRALHRARSILPRRYRLGPILISAFLCLAGIGVYMWPRVQVVRLAYRLQSAEQRLKDLGRERDELRLEIAILKDPQRVHRLATGHLGMSLARPDQVFVLSRDWKGR